MTWAAEFLTGTENADMRSAARRRLRLAAAVHRSEEAASVVLHNMSSTGLLIETGEKLELGEKFDITLPEIGATEVSVVWTNGDFYGCEFAAPISAGTISAALLCAPAQSPAPKPAPSDYYDSEQAHFGPTLSTGGKALTILGISLALWAIIALLIRPLFW